MNNKAPGIAGTAVCLSPVYTVTAMAGLGMPQPWPTVYQGPDKNEAERIRSLYMDGTLTETFIAEPITDLAAALQSGDYISAASLERIVGVTGSVAGLMHEIQMLVEARQRSTPVGMREPMHRNN